MNRAAEATWDWDWDGDPIDRSLVPARLTPDGELEPMAVDESLTTLLFSPHHVAVVPPRGSAAPPPGEPPSIEPPRIEPPPVEAAPVGHRPSADLQRALFEMA